MRLQIYLQQQKLVWSVRHCQRERITFRIYNSRNQCGLLDICLFHVLPMSDLQQQKLVWSVRLNSRNLMGVNLQQQKLVWSVRPSLPSLSCLNLQQQKLVWSVRQIIKSHLTQSYLQQQKLVWSVRRGSANIVHLNVSTIVEISVVCQTYTNEYERIRLIYNSRNQCGLLDWYICIAICIVSTIVEISVVCQTCFPLCPVSSLSTIVEISVVCQTPCVCKDSDILLKYKMFEVDQGK